MNHDDKTIHFGCTGYSVKLVKENTVHSGNYELMLEVSDNQDVSAVRNLSVTVCNCIDPAKPNCRIRKSTGSTFGGGALGIVFLSMLLLAGMINVHNNVNCEYWVKIALLFVAIFFHQHYLLNLTDIK